MTRTSLVLRMSAPYIAVLVMWVGMQNAWMALMAYHGVMMAFRAVDDRDAAAAEAEGEEFTRFPAHTTHWGSISVRAFSLAATCMGLGYLTYVTLPVIEKVDVGAWAEGYLLSGLLFALMVPYFGIVHPLLEQRHWAPLRERTPWAHVVFAGYHAIVLWALLPWAWVLLCVAVLTLVSFVWMVMARRTGGLATPVALHIFADLSIVAAAFALT